MGAASSNLASAGYDLVYAVTQDALNATMKPYVAGLNIPEISACLAIRRGRWLTAPTAQIDASIGRDLFTLSNAVPEHIFVRLERSGFRYGFKAKPGIPRGMPIAQLPDLVRLDQGASSIRHQLYFTEFEAIWIGGPQFNVRKFTQDATNPVIISSCVDLRVGDVDLSALPPDLQTQLGSLYPGVMFGIKQLFLDFAASRILSFSGADDADGRTTHPRIPFPLIPAAIVSEYWKHIPARAAALGYGVTASPAGATSLVAPTALGFVVSPHLGADGTPSGQLGLNTLDYLVMANNDAMPRSPPVPFAWNWVDGKEDEASFNGVMSIRRGLFCEFIRNALNAATAALSVSPSISSDGSASYASQSPAQWQVADPTGASPTLLTMNFQRSASGNGILLNYTTYSNFYISYTASGSVVLSPPNTLLTTVHVVVQLYFAWHFPDALQPPPPNPLNPDPVLNCRVVDYTRSARYTLGVGPGGRLLAASVSDDPVDNSEDPAEHMDTGGGAESSILPQPIEHFADSIKQKLQSATLTAMTDFETALGTALNAPNGWVFPGGRTFAASDLVFSDAGDLVVHDTYRQPH